VCFLCFYDFHFSFSICFLDFQSCFLKGNCFFLGWAMFFKARIFLYGYRLFVCFSDVVFFVLSFCFSKMLSIFYIFDHCLFVVAVVF
jgi:hypothetical protein